MELTDLMVGDYIYVGECHSNMDGDYDVFFNARPITIEDFKFWAENNWDKNDFNEFLAPIPLTTEILEKNGFEYDPYYHNWIYDEFTINYGHLIDEEEGDYLFIWVADTSMKLTYVHELQHALRLCRLNELANNFKI